ncbi:unnamed protein product [Paramecium sonneborni]|uniref:Transmembrane protein n=1 Tax=Paramecium sonneborni TaxID=65129 RepID=A0A8S1NNU8_9CILI|nr:unnamed protein product [Paramecium sonneborni]
MAQLLKALTLQFTNPIHEAQYQDFLNNQRLFFLRALLFTIMLSCFFAMLIFIVQSQSAVLISFMTVLFILHMVFLFFSYKLIFCLRHIMTILFASYVPAAFSLAYIGFNVPLYDFGIACGILFTSVLQYCDNKFKVIYVLITNWITLVLFVPFELAYIQYLVYSVSMFFLLGTTTYLIEHNRRSQFLFSQKIQSQQSILFEFSNDYLFAIIYNEQQRCFQLSFANKQFESKYKTDLNENNVRDFLRTQMIINLNNLGSNRYLLNKQTNKQLNLEEYLFDLIQQNDDNHKEDRYQIQSISEKEKYTIDILRFEYTQTIFFISIKKNQAKTQIEKYEKKIKYLNERFNQVLLCIGSRLEKLYNQMIKLRYSQDLNTDLLFQKQQCNIQYTLIYLKNFLVYQAKRKMYLLKQQYETLLVEKLIDVFSEYFRNQCYLHNKSFVLICQNQVEKIQLNLNTRLLTQLLINCFNKILQISQPQSTIEFQIDLKGISNQVLIENNENKSQGLQLIQFSYTFEHKDKIENIESKFYQQINQDSQMPVEIECIVNLIILNILGSQNFIQNKSTFQEDQVNYKTILQFYIYTDQTQLEPSFTKFIQRRSLDY